MKNKLEEIIKLANELKDNLENNKKIEIKEENGRRYFEHLGIRYDEFKPNYFLSKDILSKEVIEDIVKDKRYLGSDNEVRYNNDIFDNSWENSFVRKVLNSTFKEKYLTSLSLNGEIRLLTKEEVEELPENLKKIGQYYWTMSPYNFNSSAYGAYVLYVNTSGYLSTSTVVYNTYGVRPVIKLNTDELL